MHHRPLLKSGLSARFLLAAVGLTVAVSACGDDDPGPYDGGGGTSAGSGGSKAGASGSGTTAGTSTTAGTGGSSTGTAGAGGDPGGGTGGSTPQGGTGGSAPQAGAGGEPIGEAGMGQGGSGEGGQGGAPPEEPAKLVVFADGYAEGVGFVPFGGSSAGLSVDATTAHSGASSLKIEVPATNYIGGALVAAPQDLSQYNAVSFWIKASADHPLNTVGFGDNGSGGNALFTSRNLVEVTTTWQRIIIPIPSPSKVTAETGLFYFAEGSEHGAYTLWIDDVEFTTVEGISAPVPAIATETRNLNVGASSALPKGNATYTIGGATIPFEVGPSHFDYISSDEGVASVTNAVITADDVGTTEITAELEGVLATGKITVNAAIPVVPTVAAPTPTQLPADVIALFSDAYPNNVPVSTWSAGWDKANLEDLTIGGSATKLYSSLEYAGIEFTSPVIDATQMTHFHVDVWMPTSTQFGMKLVDFGDNGTYQGGVPQNGLPHDDTEGAVIKSGLTPQTWQSLDIALSEFTGLVNRAHLAQMIINESGTTVYVDNVYFYKQAPTP